MELSYYIQFFLYKSPQKMCFWHTFLGFWNPKNKQTNRKLIILSERHRVVRSGFKITSQKQAYFDIQNFITHWLLDYLYYMYLSVLLQESWTPVAHLGSLSLSFGLQVCGFWQQRFSFQNNSLPLLICFISGSSGGDVRESEDGRDNPQSDLNTASSSRQVSSSRCDSSQSVFSW